LYPKTLLVFAIVATGSSTALRAADKDLLPPQLKKEQRENLLSFLLKHEKPDRFVPADAKLVGTQRSDVDLTKEPPPKTAIKQYMVQIITHRPVPGQEEPNQFDVYYYRPNPEKGKPGITVKHTVDVSTGKKVGQTEVSLNAHTPVSQDELTEAVALARENSAALKELHKGRDEKAVHWEYLQLMIQRKNETSEPGDRVVRLVFSVDATAAVVVIVNLTKGVVTAGKM